MVMVLVPDTNRGQLHTIAYTADSLSLSIKTLSSPFLPIFIIQSSCVEALEEMGVGLRDPLVDEEGYPRSDVDLYTVRGLRHQHACLQVGLEWEEVGE